jgi:hypothetical protein
MCLGRARPFLSARRWPGATCCRIGLSDLQDSWSVTLIKNFEEVKRQLGELSEAVNKFKSEQVQLKIVELVFSGAGLGNRDETGSSASAAAKPATKGRKRRTKAATPSSSNDGTATTLAKPRNKRKAGGGPMSTLRELLAEGYFKQKRTISQLVDHCGTKLARPLKSNEISTHLGRLVRERSLTRSRNEEKQYEYTQG